MQLVVDFDVCEAHGEFVLAAPEIFELGDDEVVTVLQEEPPEDQRSQAEEAACPVAAIKVED